MQDPPKGFVDHPYPYHHELELVIENVTNLGYGIACHDGWVIQIPFTLPGERIKASIFRNHKNYSDADCMEVLTPSADRTQAECDLFGVCGGCQYQAVRYETQLEWKRNQVKDSFERIGGMEIEVEPVEPSPEPMDIGPSSHHTTREEDHRKRGRSASSDTDPERYSSAFRNAQ